MRTSLLSHRTRAPRQDGSDSRGTGTTAHLLLTTVHLAFIARQFFCLRAANRPTRVRLNQRGDPPRRDGHDLTQNLPTSNVGISRWARFPSGCGNRSVISIAASFPCCVAFRFASCPRSPMARVPDLGRPRVHRSYGLLRGRFGTRSARDGRFGLHEAAARRLRMR